MNINEFILNAFPTLQYSFTKHMYFFIGIVFLFIIYQLYLNGYNVLIIIITMFLLIYMSKQNNDKIGSDETAHFQELEKKMKILIPDKPFRKNYLYVRLELLDLLYDFKAFRLKCRKMFNEMLLVLNEFLRIVEVIEKHKRATNEQLDALYDLKKQAMNHFHSVMFRCNFEQMQKHNQCRHLLDEMLHQIFLEMKEYCDGPINMKYFGRDPYFSKYYDIY